MKNTLKKIGLAALTSVALTACGSLNTIDSSGKLHGEVKWPDMNLSLIHI